MPANVLISEMNTGSVTTDDITNMNYGSNDSYDIVIATYPINRGDYSFEKLNAYKLSNLSGSSLIDNFKVWLTGSADTGIIHLTNLSGSLENDVYATPITTVSSVCTEAMPIVEPTNENIGKSGVTGGLNTNGQYSDLVWSQVETQGGASPGDQTSRNFYWQYDEQ